METAPTPPIPLRRRRVVVMILVSATVACAAGAGTWWYATRLPKRFAAVVEGRLYRCGEVTPAQLERVHEQHGIRTVLSMLDPAVPESVAEREAAERLGVKWLNVQLRGNGASTPADRDQIRSILGDDSLSPLLVHCAAGTNRTGLAVGMYRLHHDRWPLEKVMAEMKEFDFEDEAHHENLREALRVEAAAVGSTEDIDRRATGP